MKIDSLKIMSFQSQIGRYNVSVSSQKQFRTVLIMDYG